MEVTQDQMDIINSVINNISKKYVFYGYELEDIKQESFIICMEGLKRWDRERPLQNFLSVHLSNRLKNFVRDNHFLGSPEENAKAKIRKPAQLDYEDNTLFSETKDDFDIKEMSERIDANIPSSMRLDYLKMMHGVSIQTARKQEIMEKVRQILGVEE